MAFMNSVTFQSRIRREGTVFALAAALFFAVAVVGAAQDEDKPAEISQHAASAAGATKKGDEIFHTRCLICHNKQPGDSSPFGPPNLFQVFKTRAITAPQAEQIISKGKGPMPAFGTVLSKGDVQSVIAYLKTGKE